MKTRVFNCDAALWIGPTDHFEMQPLWRICQDHCDTIAIRSSIQSATESAPRRPVSHVVIAQTTRHDLSTKALDHGSDSIHRLRANYSDAKVLVVRGSLVAPLVQLPSTHSNANKHWVESISHLEANHLLAAWLNNEPPIAMSPSPLLIVASTLDDADAIMSSIAMVAHKRNVSPPWMTWSRDLSQNRFRGVGTILWDDSAAPPATTDAWRQRIDQSPTSRHLWATGIANRNQRQTAIESGIANIIEKPSRFESLLCALAVGDPSLH